MKCGFIIFIGILLLFATEAVNAQSITINNPPCGLEAGYDTCDQDRAGPMTETASFTAIYAHPRLQIGVDGACYAVTGVSKRACVGYAVKYKCDAGVWSFTVQQTPAGWNYVSAANFQYFGNRARQWLKITHGPFSPTEVTQLYGGSSQPMIGEYRPTVPSVGNIQRTFTCSNEDDRSFNGGQVRARTYRYATINASTEFYNVRCVLDTHCLSTQYCNRTGAWDQWACVTGTRDKTAPVTSITAPPDETTHDVNFSVTVSDVDETSLNQNGCEYKIINSGTETKGWTQRQCNASFGLSVGSTADCRDSTANVCTVVVRSRDLANNISPESRRNYTTGHPLCTACQWGKRVTNGLITTPEFGPTNAFGNNTCQCVTGSNAIIDNVTINKIEIDNYDSLKSLFYDQVR